uniref:Zona pellucida sperm-binding protein 3 n=1 Tax=Periophthalmus magnuspinnatus TaxID=409849 RepID=A0A3B4AMY0_9GOBI
MLKTFTWFINIVVLFTLTKCQRYNHGADQPHVKKWENDVHDPFHTSKLQSGGCPRAVVVRCHPDSLEVIIQADMFNTGLVVEASHLRLGLEEQMNPNVCKAAPSGPSEFTIRAHLMDCGTPSEKIVYSNVLVYAPKPSPEGLLRLEEATIPIECHYNKFHSVNSLSVFPTWTPFVLRTTIESQMDFSLRLMTGDWQFERDSHAYYVGDPIYFEASSISGNHKPLRVFVDHCVATVTPDAEAALRYDLIDHHGCFVDAYLTNSTARFLSRAEDNRIQFQLDAFKFYQENTKQIYITCHLTAVPTSVKSKHKACSLIANRYFHCSKWRSADGNDEDCRTCGVPYPIKETSTTASPTVVSPRRPAQSMLKSKPAKYIWVRPQTHQNVHPKPPSSTAVTKEAEKINGKLNNEWFSIIINMYVIVELGKFAFLYFSGQNLSIKHGDIRINRVQ